MVQNTRIVGKYEPASLKQTRVRTDGPYIRLAARRLIEQHLRVALAIFSPERRYVFGIWSSIRIEGHDNGKEGLRERSNELGVIVISWDETVTESEDGRQNLNIVR